MSLSRRKFLGLLAATSITPIVLRQQPATTSEWLPGCWINWSNNNRLESVDGYYTVIAHPSLVADLVAMDARARWKDEWRRQRLQRRGVIAETPYYEIGNFQGARIHGAT